MSFRTILVIVLALVCGVTAALGVSAVLNVRPPAQVEAKEVETMPVVVAVADTGRFMSLKEDLVKVRQFPKDMFAPEEVFATVEEVVDRSLTVPVIKGEPIMKKRVSEKGMHGIEAHIPDDMRAISILTQNAAAGVAGFILPGSKVDVQLTLDNTGMRNDPTGGAATFTLLENIEILAVTQVTDVPNQNKINPSDLQSVTLLVTIPQSEALNLASNKGKLHLSLRNSKDKGHVKPHAITLADLLPGNLQPQPEQQPPPETPQEKPVDNTPVQLVGQILIQRGLNESFVNVPLPQPETKSAVPAPIQPPRDNKPAPRLPNLD
jgi:pilus assembly protein CpaB